jgi:hypothetical protein
MEVEGGMKGLLTLIFNRPANQPKLQPQTARTFQDGCVQTTCFLQVYQPFSQDQQTIQKLHGRAV